MNWAHATYNKGFAVGDLTPETFDMALKVFTGMQDGRDDDWWNEYWMYTFPRQQREFLDNLAAHRRHREEAKPKGLLMNLREAWDTVKKVRRLFYARPWALSFIDMNDDYDDLKDTRLEKIVQDIVYDRTQGMLEDVERIKQYLRDQGLKHYPDDSQVPPRPTWVKDYASEAVSSTVRATLDTLRAGGQQ